MARIALELPAYDLDRAARFYQVAFGWSHLRLPFDYVLFDAGGRPVDPADCDGGFSPRTEFVRVPVPIVTVASIDETAATVAANGGEILSGKGTVGTFGASMYVRDCEGTVLCLWQGAEEREA